MKLIFSIILLLATTLPASAQVSGWLNGDFGTPSAAGSAAGSSTITLNDAGAQLWERQNSSGHLLYNWTRDQSTSSYLTAQVTSIASTDPYAQACVGFFEGRNHNSRFAAACLTKSGTVQLIARVTPFTDFRIIATQLAQASQPYLRIKRSLDGVGGYTITADHSANGSIWTTLGTIRIPRLPTICIVGLASSSHDTTARATTFANVTNSLAVLTNVFFASTAGTGSGTGTENSPYTLDQALRTSASSIPAGSVLFLRGGTYRAKPIVTLAGASGNQTEIRDYPGEHAIINGSVRKTLVTAITTTSGANSCGFTLSDGDYLQPNVKLTLNNEDLRIANCTFGCTVIGDPSPGGCVRGDNGTTPSTYAVGQIVGIWGSVVTISGSYLDVYDIEPTQDYTNRVNVDGRYAGVAQNEDQQWPSYIGPGISNAGTNNNFYGVFNHDNADGFSSFTAVDGNIDSSFSFNNGGGGVNRCNGHGAYQQSQSTNTRYIRRFLSVNNFAAGAKIGAVSGPVLNYTMDQGILQNGGAQCLRGTWATTGQGVQTLDFVTDGLPIQNGAVTNSVIWGNPKSSTQVVFFGYVNANNDQGTFTNNYVLNGNRLLLAQNWRRATIQNNFFYYTNTPQSPAIVTNLFTTYGPFSGTATLTGTTLTRTSGDNFQPTSWGSSLCVEGCQNQLSLTGGACGNGNYVVVTDSVAPNGQTLQLTQGVAGTCTNLHFSVAQVQSHPIAGSNIFNNNTYWNNLASNDLGSTPASSDNAKYVFIWARNNRAAATSNFFGSTSGTCFGGSTLSAPPQTSGATDCSWTGWSGNDSMSVFNTGKPSVAANFTQFNKLLDGLGQGWKAFIWSQDWTDNGSVVLSTANLNSILQVGDVIEIRKGENPDSIVYSGTYTGSAISFAVTDRSVRAATGWSFVVSSTWPRAGALILIVR